MKKYALSEIFEIIGGGTPKTTNSEYWNGDIPWLSVKDFNSDEKWVDSAEKSITEKGLKESSTSILHPGDLIVSARGTVGALAMVSRDMAFNQSCYGLRAKKGFDIDYTYYLLKGTINKLKANTHGSVFDTITRDTFDQIFISVPEYEVQKKIGVFLSNLDEKIRVNTRINKNLLEQAISIFNWFYDSSTHQQPFSSVINVFGGGTPKTSDPNFWNGDIPFFTPKDVGNPYTFKTEKYITDDGLAKCNSRLYPTNTTFVTARGTVGKVSLAGVPMAMNQSCYALVSDTLNPILVYFYTLKVVSSLKHKASGAVFDAIVTRDFDNEMINILSDTDAQQLLEVVTPMFAAIHNNDAECLRLSALRDAILPKLLSGELAFEAN